MLKNAALLTTVVALGACATDESISKFAEAGAEYVLVELDGAPFTARATITFPQEGRIEGQAPCNSYFATQTVPYPWFAVEAIGATRMACPDLDAETAFFGALEDMTLSEVLGDTLILTNSADRKMVFVAR